MVIAIDFETNEGAIDGDLREVYCMGYWSDDDMGMGMGVLLTTAEIIDFFYSHPDETFVMHNASFDNWILQFNYGIYLSDHQIEDTQLMAYLLNYKGVSLNKLSEFIFNESKIDFTDFTHGYSEEMGSYCLQDCRLTYKLYKHLMKQMEDDPTVYELYKTVEKPYIQCIIEMQNNGIFIDLERYEELIGTIHEQTKALKSEVLEIVPYAPGSASKTKNTRSTGCPTVDLALEIHNPENDFHSYVLEKHDEEKGVYHWRKIEPFNPDSTQQTAWALNYLYGWNGNKKTGSGKPCVNQDVLKELSFPLARKLVDYYKLKKIDSTYGQSLLDMIKEDGRIHPSYNQCVTLTGRLSSSKPNAQNFPKRGETGSIIRSLFKAEEDHVLVGMDLDAFQVRIFAWYAHMITEQYGGDSGSNYLYDCFIANPYLDPHDANATIMYGESFSSEQRGYAKNCMFGELFGIGTAKFSAQSNLEFKEAERVRELFRSSVCPGLEGIKEYVNCWLEDTGGYIYTAFGRRGYYPNALIKDDSDLSSRAQRQAFNFLIQGTEADIMKIIQNLCMFSEEYLKLRVRQIIQIHDEIVWEVPRIYAEEWVDFVNRIMEEYRYRFLPAIPIVGTPVIGETWKDTK